MGFGTILGIAWCLYVYSVDLKSRSEQTEEEELKLIASLKEGAASECQNRERTVIESGMKYLSEHLSLFALAGLIITTAVGVRAEIKRKKELQSAGNGRRSGQIRHRERHRHLISLSTHRGTPWEN